MFYFQQSCMEHIELVNRGTPKSHHHVFSSEEDDLREQDKFLPENILEGSRSSKKKRGKISLKREITLLSGVALVAGQIIGSGIYVAPHIILTYAGSFGVSLLLWLFGAVIAIFGSLCYVELGLLTKRSGGEFLYLTKAYSFKHKNHAVTVLGSVMGFLSIWSDFCVVRPSSLAVAVLLCAKYFIRPFFIGCDLPDLAVKCFAIAILSKQIPIEDLYCLVYTS